MYRKDNCDEVKGGIIVYVSEEIAVTRDKKIDSLNIQFKESMWLTLEIHKVKIMFGVVYRKGSSNAQNNTLMREIIKQVSNRYENVLMCGDFNHPEIDWPSNSVKGGPYSPQMRFFDCLNDNYLKQHVLSPTRARGSDKPSLIDLIVTEDTSAAIHRH